MQHQKKIDNEWKAKVKREKEEFAQKNSSNKNTKIERVYDQIFTKFIQDITMQMNMAIQANDIEAAKHFILLLETINHKTKGRQPFETADIFKHIDMIKVQVGSAVENFISEDEEPENQNAEEPENQNSGMDSPIIS